MLHNQFRRQGLLEIQARPTPYRPASAVERRQIAPDSPLPCFFGLQCLFVKAPHHTADTSKVAPLSTTKALLETRDTTEAEPTETLSNRSLERPDERILYVDDEEIARKTFADAATQLGFRVDTADGGGQALALASRYRYAVIAADLRMPTLNGLSLIQLLRPKWPDATYLIVTGASHLDLPTQANGEPLVDEILSKPWTVKQLAKILKRAVAQAQHRRAQSSNRPQDLPILVVEDDPENVAGLRQLVA